MKKTSLMFKLTLVVIITLVMATLLTGVVYSLLSQRMFAGIKAAEMLPKARALGQVILEIKDDDLGDPSAGRLLDKLKSSDGLLDGYFLVVDEDGSKLAASDALNEEIMDELSDFVDEVLEGREISGYITVAFNIQVVGVGIPLIRDDKVLGGVLLFVPLYEAMAAVGTFRYILIIVLMIIMPLTMLVLSIIIARITRPLRQMRDVALSMASGKADLRADENQAAEIGQLAMSLNYLSYRLNNSISELTVERNRLKQAVDGLMEGFISVNSFGEIIYINPAFKDMFPADETLTMDKYAILNRDEVWNAFDEAVEKSVLKTVNFTFLTRVIKATISPVTNEEGKTVGAVGLFTDITESERLERTRRDYVANVSHELRTPLTALRGLIEPMRDGMVKNEETRQRYYDIIYRETLRLSRLIDDLLVLSRLQSGKLVFDPQRVNLGEIVEDLADKYTSVAMDKSQTFELLTAPKDCPVVLANADRVEQVMVILLDNAMKYTPEGGKISLKVTRKENKAVIDVSDNGIGISEEDLPYVFDRFYKADKSHTGSNGSGLGLSIASEMLHHMGENISVKSTIGQGSTFSFTLTCMK